MEMRAKQPINSEGERQKEKERGNETERDIVSAKERMKANT